MPGFGSGFGGGMNEAIKRRMAQIEKTSDADKQRAAEEAQRRAGYGRPKTGG